MITFRIEIMKVIANKGRKYYILNLCRLYCTVIIMPIIKNREIYIYTNLLTHKCQYCVIIYGFNSVLYCLRNITIEIPQEINIIFEPAIIKQ